MDIPVTDEHRQVLELIQSGDEKIDLVPGTYKGEDVVQIVQWLTDDFGDPTMKYKVLGLLLRDGPLKQIVQPELVSD